MCQDRETLDGLPPVVGMIALQSWKVFGTIPDECRKKMKDKNTDPKQLNAFEALHKAVSQLEMLVGKMC